MNSVLNDGTTIIAIASPFSTAALSSYLDGLKEQVGRVYSYVRQSIDVLGLNPLLTRRTAITRISAGQCSLIRA